MASIKGGLPFWGESPELWDTVAIGGVTLPGICRVSGTGAQVRSDKKRAAGRDGANVAMLGLDIVAFSIEVRMWREEHLEVFQEIIAMAKPKKKPIKKTETNVSIVTSGKETFNLSQNSSSSKVKNSSSPLDFSIDKKEIKTSTETTIIGYDLVPLEISHPALQLFGITQCVIKSITIPVEQSPGLFVSTIHCDEFNKSKQRKVTRAVGGERRQGVGILDGIEAADLSPSKTNSGPNAR